MNNIKSFNEYKRDFVWDPIRKPIDPQYMPDESNIAEYKQSVKEEIHDLLLNTYQLGPNDIEKIQEVLWKTNIKDWKDILDDCLVNWDTPAQCAQRCLTKMKTIFNLT